MSRLDQVLKYVDKSKLGIEVAPYHNPLLRKSDGYDVLILDVMDTAVLREMARNDPNISDEGGEAIEEVDVVGDASNIGPALQERGLAGKVHYVVSSHNFEHLPNPIKFLQGVSASLAPGGVLSMAVPDCRACFDHFRMPTRLSDWLTAFHNDHTQPTPGQIFDAYANIADYMGPNGATVGCNIATGDLNKFVAGEKVAWAYQRFTDQMEPSPPYIDTHCNVTFGTSMELMLGDLQMLGLIDLEVIEVTQTLGLEYFVHLRKPDGPTTFDEAAYFARRAELQHQLNREIGAQGFARARSKPPLELMSFSKGLRTVLKRQKHVAQIADWNHRRLKALKEKRKTRG